MGKANGDKALNTKIEQAFFQKAVGGWEQREEKTVTEDDGKGGQKEKREVLIKRAAPDLDAIRAWLRERAPERWAGEGDKAQGGMIRVVSQVPRPEETGAPEKEEGR